jgi:hypothetical protein
MLAMAWPRQILKSVHGERTTPRMTLLIRNLSLFAVVWWRTSTKRSDKRKKKEADKGHKSALAGGGLAGLLAIRRAAFEKAGLHNASWKMPGVTARLKVAA